MAMQPRLLSIFDILGPIMTGPSSSDTAGATRIGLMGRQFLGAEPESVTIHFYSSLAATYKGHMLCTGLDPSTMTLTFKSLGAQDDADWIVDAVHTRIVLCDLHEFPFTDNTLTINNISNIKHILQKA